MKEASTFSSHVAIKMILLLLLSPSCGISAFVPPGQFPDRSAAANIMMSSRNDYYSSSNNMRDDDDDYYYSQDDNFSSMQSDWGQRQGGMQGGYYYDEPSPRDLTESTSFGDRDERERPFQRANDRDGYWSRAKYSTPKDTQRQYTWNDQRQRDYRESKFSREPQWPQQYNSVSRRRPDNAAGIGGGVRQGGDEYDQREQQKRVNRRSASSSSRLLAEDFRTRSSNFQGREIGANNDRVNKGYQIDEMRDERGKRQLQIPPRPGARIGANIGDKYTPSFRRGSKSGGYNYKSEDDLGEIRSRQPQSQEQYEAANSRGGQNRQYRKDFGRRERDSSFDDDDEIFPEDYGEDAQYGANFRAVLNQQYRKEAGRKMSSSFGDKMLEDYWDEAPKSPSRQKNLDDSFGRSPSGANYEYYNNERQPRARQRREERQPPVMQRREDQQPPIRPRKEERQNPNSFGGITSDDSYRRGEQTNFRYSEPRPPPTPELEVEDDYEDVDDYMGREDGGKQYLDDPDDIRNLVSRGTQRIDNDRRLERLKKVDDRQGAAKEKWQQRLQQTESNIRRNINRPVQKNNDLFRLPPPERSGGDDRREESFIEKILNRLRNPYSAYGGAFSADPMMGKVNSEITKSMEEEQRSIKNMLADARAYLLADPAVRSMLGGSISLGKPLSKTASSTMTNGMTKS